MTVTYKTTVTNTTSRNIAQFESVVTSVSWDMVGTDENGNMGIFRGVSPLNVDNLDEDTFIPIEKMTDEILLEWISTVISSDPVYNQHIIDQINSDITANQIVVGVE